MPQKKRAASRTSRSAPRPAAEPDNDTLAQALVDMALEIAECEDEADPAPRDARGRELTAALRKALRRKRDDVLYGAIELARYADLEAWRLLRGRVEEEAATLRIRREGAPALEIDAFLVPLFVQSTGGLAADETFQDEQAFEQLVASFGQTGLDSAGAKVALMRHAYDLAEIDHIAFSTLHEMLREAAASMMDKKLAPAPVLQASIRGWTGERFGPDDPAMELRFLLGFSLKRTDDPFYHAPADEAGADDYFAARLERYRHWTVAAAPLLRRCLAADPERLTLNFLYQDLFYGAKEQGVAELAMLGALSEVNRVLAEKELAPGDVHAVVAPMGAGEHAVLRVNLYAADGGEPWGGADKPFDPAADLGAEVGDLCDALTTLGLERVSVARGFSADGRPEGAVPFGEASA